MKRLPVSLSSYLHLHVLLISSSATAAFRVWVREENEIGDANADVGS